MIEEWTARIVRTGKKKHFSFWWGLITWCTLVDIGFMLASAADVGAERSIWRKNSFLHLYVSFSFTNKKASLLNYRNKLLNNPPSFISLPTLSRSTVSFFFCYCCLLSMLFSHCVWWNVCTLATRNKILYVLFFLFNTIPCWCFLLCWSTK